MSQLDSQPEALPEPESREILEQIGCPLFQPHELTKYADRLNWLWHGYLANGQITLLTGQWKIGKTALLAALLARLGAGGQVGGREVRAGRAVVLSEEGAAMWSKRCAAFGIGDHVSFAFRPFLHRPSPNHWKWMCESVASLHRRKKIDLLAIDPLATQWPCADENHAPGVTEALQPLRDVAACGIAVLLLHHPRKERIGGGREARGSGALSAFVDCLIEMNWYGVPESADRRRRLLAWSRHDATPRELLIELTADGADYVSAAPDAPGAATAAVVRQLLESEPDLTVRDLLACWPAGSARPAPTVLHRHLSRAVADGQLVCSGAGHRYEPYRYRLPEESRTAGS